jgi:hypothetical protein
MSQDFTACKKNTSKYEQRCLEGQIHSLLRQVPPDLLLDGSAGRLAREIWWTNEEYYPVDIIPPCFSMLINQLTCWP